MKIKQIILGNFQGTKNLSIDLGGKNTSIYGANGTGKSTIFNAICWLLFDKGSDYKSINPKTLDKEGGEIHGLEHAVEAVFIKDEGGEVSLKKILTEKWTKKRGAASKVFSGHATKYLVDGVPKRLAEFKQVIATLAGGEDTFKLLSSPFYFSSFLPWKDRRKLVVEVCKGENLFEEVIKSTKSLATFPEMLKGRSVDDFRKIVIEERKKVNKALEEIPIRIDEISIGDTDDALPPRFPVLPELEALNSRKREISDILMKQTLAGAAPPKSIVLQEEITALELDKDKLLFDHKTKIQEKLNNIQSEQYTLKTQTRNIEIAKNEAEGIRRIIAKNQAILAEKREEYRSIAKSKFVPSEKDEQTCPTCGQRINSDMGKSIWEKEKAAKLAEINKSGKAIKENTSKLADELTKLSEIISTESQTKKDMGSLDAMQTKLEDLMQEVPEQAQLLEKQIEEKKAALRNVLAEELAKKSNLEQSAVEDYSAEISDIDAAIAIHTLKDSNEARITELKKEERRLGKVFERCEKALWLVDEYTKALVSLLERKARESFGGVGFKLFKELVNGGIEPCCEVLFDGVPFNGGLNHSAQINSGIKIINTLSEHYGMRLPIWVDNAEAVNVLEKTENQVIRLVVSEDKKLKIV